MQAISLSGTTTYVSSATYDSAGRLKTRALGNGLSQVYAYYLWGTKGGRLNTITTGSLQDLSYDYDPSGNITQITDNVAGETHKYSYDALDRLLDWKLNNVLQESYSYDLATGNLINKGGTTLAYNNAAHDHAVTNAGSDSYTYDPNGNQVTRTVNGITLTLGYDADNRMVSVTGTGFSASFSYDADGQRVKSNINGNVTTFVGSWYEVTGSTVNKYYVFGGALIAMRKDGTLYYPLTDRQGSTTVTTDATGAKVSELRYKPWGENRTTAGTTPTKRTYTGQYDYTADFGLYFYNARWNDPYLNRFAQPDTIIPPGVQGLDRYAYANNSPIVYSDPSGHMAWEGDGGDYNWRKKADDEYRKLLAANKHWEADSAWGLMAGALRHEPHMDIVGKGLDEIANDPIVDKLITEEDIKTIQNDPSYGVEDFSIDQGITSCTFGETGNMLEDATLGQTWTVRAANVATSVDVSKSKEIIIKYNLSDTLDLRPDWHSGARTGKSGFFYNVITTITGAIWHNFIGASDQMTTSATWYVRK